MQKPNGKHLNNNVAVPYILRQWHLIRINVSRSVDAVFKQSIGKFTHIIYPYNSPLLLYNCVRSDFFLSIRGTIFTVMLVVMQQRYTESRSNSASNLSTERNSKLLIKKISFSVFHDAVCFRDCQKCLYARFFQDAYHCNATFSSGIKIMNITPKLYDKVKSLQTKMQSLSHLIHRILIRAQLPSPSWCESVWDFWPVKKGFT